MPGNGQPGEEPQVPSEEGVEEVKPSASQAPWSGLNWTIKEEDIKSVKDFKLVSKMLLGEINRLMGEVKKMRSITQDYYAKSTDLAVLNERLKGLQESVNVRALLFSLGGLLGGLAFLPDWETNLRLGVFFLSFICFVVAVSNPDWLKRTIGKK